MQNDLSVYSASLRAVRELTPSIREFEIVPENGPLHWTAGSHLEIGVMIDGKPHLRSYSLVGSAAQDCYRIAVKLVESSRGGSRYMWSLEPGARLSISAPKNHFALSAQVREVLLIAGGIGITPIASMAEALAGGPARVRMLYGARHGGELAYGEHLRSLLGNRLSLFLDDQGQKMDLAAEFATLPADAEVYICGPMPLLDAAKRAWAASGRATEGLRFETFGNSGNFAPEPIRIAIPRHQCEIIVPADKTVLDALVEAGIEVLWDCKRGECGLCALDVIAVEGKIDHRDVFLSEHERSTNARMCVCVSRAVGGKLVLDSSFRSD